MKKKWIIGCTLLLSAAMAFDKTVEGLRGDVAVDEEYTEMQPYQIMEGYVPHKNYRQQPPLVPHQVDKYQINMKANQCLRCHEWPYNTDFKTVKASETHYINAQSGERTDKVSAERWFCTQCHVPQLNAPELIENTFISADQ